VRFFNPVPLMKLVEVLRGFSTKDATVEVTAQLAQKMGKVTLKVKKGSPNNSGCLLLAKRNYMQNRMGADSVITCSYAASFS
jgi:3-hydroxyacyl-CoA dehydrogenase